MGSTIEWESLSESDCALILLAKDSNWLNS